MVNLEPSFAALKARGAVAAGCVAALWSMGCGCGATPSSDATADATADASGDAGPGTDGGAAGSDAATTDGASATAARVGIVWVGETYGVLLQGTAWGGFVAAVEVAYLETARVAIAGAADCYEVVPPPPVVPNYLDAGGLTVDGVDGAPLVVTRTMTGDYAWSGGALFSGGGPSVTASAAGSADFLALGATVPAPDTALAPGVSPSAGGGSAVTWTPGNGDYVILRFANSEGTRECVVPDDGSFTIAAAAFAPDAGPLGGAIEVRRVVETIVQTFSIPPDELRLRAFVEDQAL